VGDKGVKRDALIRNLRRYARKHGSSFDVDVGAGKGSHYRVRLGQAVTTIQSGELSPFHVERICKQLRVDLKEL
jgi:hypothetical protein